MSTLLLSVNHCMVTHSCVGVNAERSLIVAIVAAIANIFLGIPALSLAVSAAIVFIMSGFILYDTSRIINGGETNYIRATVAMYLNIYNLFTSILHLLGAFGGDD